MKPKFISHDSSWLMLMTLLFLQLVTQGRAMKLYFQYEGNALTNLRIFPGMDLGLLELMYSRGDDLKSAYLPTAVTIETTDGTIPRPLASLPKDQRLEYYLRESNKYPYQIMMSREELNINFFHQYVWCIFGKQALACKKAEKLIEPEPHKRLGFYPLTMFYSKIDNSAHAAKELKLLFAKKAEQYSQEAQDMPKISMMEL